MDKSIKKRQFAVVWFVEVWERYAFYGFQSLFLLFITSERISESEAYLIFGIFAALLYLTPTIGGYIADKYIGIKRALITGGILLFIGYALLALSDSLNTVFWALSFIITGNGLFKPTPTALISKIFNKNDASTHSAFTLYYMGVNIGSFLGIAIVPIIAKYTNYANAFWISVLGMIVALLNYTLRAKLLNNINGECDGKAISLKKATAVGLAVIIQILICYQLFQISDISFYLIIGFCLVMFVYMFKDALRLQNRKQRFTQIVGIILVFEAVVYFIVYNQMFSTLVLFAKHNVDLSLIGFKVSPASYSAVDSIWLILLSPILAILYAKFKKNKSLNVPNKYVFGTFISGIAFISLYIICLLTAKQGMINGNWMIFYFFFAALAELLIAAIGFSLIAIYFRKEIVTIGMGFFMLAVAAGSVLSGKLGQLVAMPDAMVDPIHSLPVYMHYFIGLGLACIGLSVVYFILTLFIKTRARYHQVELH